MVLKAKTPEVIREAITKPVVIQGLNLGENGDFKAFIPAKIKDLILKVFISQFFLLYLKKLENVATCSGVSNSMTLMQILDKF